MSVQSNDLRQVCDPSNGLLRYKRAAGACGRQVCQTKCVKRCRPQRCHKAPLLRCTHADTHITPVVPARRDVCISVAHAITDPRPVPGAVGKLGDDSGVKAGRVSTVEVHDAARIDIIAARTRAALCRVEVQAAAGTGAEAAKVRSAAGHLDTVSRLSVRRKP